MYIQSSDLSIEVFESRVPTPIEKKTMNGIQRYGWILNSVNADNNGADNKMPPSKIRICSAPTCPIRVLKNNPKVSGSKNTKTTPSILIWNAHEEKPLQKSVWSNDVKLLPYPDSTFIANNAKIPTKIIT